MSVTQSWSRFWVALLLQQLRRTPMNRQIGLQLADPSVGGRELRSFAGRDAGLEAGVSARLAAPGVERLLAHLEFCGDVRDPSACLDQGHDPLPELRRVAPPCHIAFLLQS